MRWKTEIKQKPYHGQQRVVTGFALFPVKTEDGEVRWLERVNIMQTYLKMLLSQSKAGFVRC